MKIGIPRCCVVKDKSSCRTKRRPSINGALPVLLCPQRGSLGGGDYRHISPAMGGGGCKQRNRQAKWLRGEKGVLWFKTRKFEDNMTDIVKYDIYVNEYRVIGRRCLRCLWYMYVCNTCKKMLCWCQMTRKPTFLRYSAEGKYYLVIQIKYFNTYYVLLYIISPQIRTTMSGNKCSSIFAQSDFNIILQNKTASKHQYHVWNYLI